MSAELQECEQAIIRSPAYITPMFKMQPYSEKPLVLSFLFFFTKLFFLSVTNNLQCPDVLTVFHLFKVI